MYCPECGGEFRPGIEICTTCDVPLTDEPAPKSHLKSGAGGGDEPRLAPSWFDLVGYLDEREGRDARRRLKEARIPSELVIRDAFGQREGKEAGDEYWIRVPGDSVRSALEVLELDRTLGEDACTSCGAPLQGGDQCPRCGHAYEA